MQYVDALPETRRVRSGEVIARGVGLLLVVPVALVSFVRDRCIQWAAALAYYTLIGLVPLLVALFSFIKAVGLHRGLTPFIVQTIGAGSPEVAGEIVRFIDRTNVGAVGILSTLGAVLAVFAILGNAELCLNTLWGGIPGRPLVGKARAFMGVAVTVPLMFLLALAGTTFLRRDAAAHAFFEQLYLGALVFHILRVIPYILLWVSFAMLYTVLPNRVVRMRSAVIGAVVASFLWQLAQWGYVTFVIKLVRYSAVYGALWQLPILLAWVYVAWSIILFGAEVCRVHHQEVDAQLTLRRVGQRRRDTERDE
jgi:membrane protein